MIEEESELPDSDSEPDKLADQQVMAELRVILQPAGSGIARQTRRPAGDAIWMLRLVGRSEMCVLSQRRISAVVWQW